MTYSASLSETCCCSSAWLSCSQINWIPICLPSNPPRHAKTLAWRRDPLQGQKLTFSNDGNRIIDAETGSTWNVLGQAVDGPLAGERLEPVVHGNHFWFSWAAFKPDTIIFGS